MPSRSLLPILLVAALASACGQSPLSSPTGPTGMLAPAASRTDLGGGLSADLSAGELIAQENASRPAHHQAGGSYRELSGSVTAKGIDSLTVRGVTVKVEHATLIRRGEQLLTIAEIQVGDHVEVRGITDGTAVIASEIKVEDRDGDEDEDDDDDDKAEVKGEVSALTGACPNLTFTVGGTWVTTDGTTDFRGTECHAIVNGVRVDIQGPRQADGRIIATKVDTRLGEDEVRGAVSGLTGTCPALTFMAGATRVTTNVRTEFKGKGCNGILNGVNVEAKGTGQTDGSIIAVKVDVGVGHDEDKARGSVSGLAGTCPNLTFMVGTTRVATSGTTKFDGAACGALANGARIEAEGARQADGSLVAAKVKFDDD